MSSNNDERSSSDSESWKQSESTGQTPDDDSASIINFPLDTSEGRSLPNVLKRISNIVALKSNVSFKDVFTFALFLHKHVRFTASHKIFYNIYNYPYRRRIYVRIRILS